MNAGRLVLPLVVCAVAVLQIPLEGCSMVGLGLGAMIDRGRSDSILVQSWQVDTLKVGTHISLLLSDGSKLSGTYTGIVHDSLYTYQRRYADFVAGLPAPPPYPAPGDSLVLYGLQGLRAVRLAAYDYNGLTVQEPGALPGTLENVSKFKMVLYRGAEIRRGELLQWLRMSRAPLLSSVVLSGPEFPEGERRVPLSEIYGIQRAKPGHAAVTGFIVGLFVDVTALIIIVSSSNDDHVPAPSSGSESSSCPYVYSHDGRDYVLDGEAFAGAILRSRQETDCCLLEHLTAQDGTCRLKLAGRIPETQFVDALEVVAIDHLPGIEVIPSAPGRYHTIAAPLAPFSATDYAGCVVTDLLAVRDSSSWISNPAGRDPESVAARRDGLVLRFGRSAGAEQARLVFTVRNTPWLVELEHHLLSQAGPLLGLWRAEMNASAGPRRTFDELLQREAGMRVDIWDGRTWQAAGSLPFVGAGVARSVALPLELPAAEPNELYVRLEATPGLWAVDRVAVDYTVDSVVHVTPLELQRAASSGERDTRRDLVAIDGDYCELGPDDEADITFAAPPARPGLQRSYAMLCTGYYTVHVRPQAHANRALLRELAQEPGAFSSYSLALINRWLEATGPSAQAAVLTPSR